MATGEELPLMAQHDDAGDGAGAADVVGEADLGLFHLALATLAAQLGDAFVDHAYAAGADRVTERFETATRIDRDVTAEGGAALVHQLAALALGAEAEVFDVGELGPGEAVVDLGEVDVLWCDA